jgi:hypothetical protein
MTPRHRFHKQRSAKIVLRHFTLIGTNLWFITSSGGGSSFGGISYFDTYNTNVVQVIPESLDPYALDNASGRNPQAASLVMADGLGWFTTGLGGTGAKGSLCSIDVTNWTLSNVYSFPVNCHNI